MSHATLLDSFKIRIISALAGTAKITPIDAIAFGDGGHDTENPKRLPIDVRKDQTALNHELIRKKIRSVIKDAPMTVEAKGDINYAEVVGEYISEVGILDELGNFIAIRNFAAKVKEQDENYAISLNLKV